MNTRAWILKGLTSVTLLGLVAGSVLAKTDDPKSPSWSAKMQKTRALFEELQADLVSDSRFNDPKNSAAILKKAKQLSEFAHQMKIEPGTRPDLDPSLQFMGDLFSEDARRAVTALEKGYRPYARQLLRSITGRCIACHTRNDMGPAYVDSVPETLVKGMGPAERAEFLVSTRRYEPALTEITGILKNGDRAQLRPFEMTQAARLGLLLTLRVNRDPKAGLKLVETLLENESTPLFLREDARVWKTTLQNWAQEIAQAPAAKAPLGEDKLLAEAERLVGIAQKVQAYPADHSSDAAFLRASGAIHDTLVLGPNTKVATRALYLAGTTYQSLRLPLVGDLHETYFEACVHHAPGSELAESCFRRLEQSVLEGYTGSAGTDLPIDVRNRLGRLRVLSRKKP